MFHQVFQGYVLSTGGGIVEGEDARQQLKSYADNGGIVLHLHRDLDETVTFLAADTTRPAYSSEVQEVWLRRENGTMNVLTTTSIPVTVVLRMNSTI